MKKRLDVLMVERGLAESREKAKVLILAGKVLVNGEKVFKPSRTVPEDSQLTLLSSPKYVSRGGEKLESALEEWEGNVEGKICLDVGSSTGGFTHCLLQRGAARVYAVDVGKNQLDYRLRTDPRVVVHEETDARELSEKHVPQPVDVITVDVSFISLTKVLPAVVKFLKVGGCLFALVKPQFELGREKVKGGVVKDPQLQMEAVEKVVKFGKTIGLKVLKIVPSRVRGKKKGNQEYFVIFEKERGVEER